MNLTEFLQAGTASNDYVKKTIEWKNGDETVKAQITVKKEMSVADYEAVFLAPGEDKSVLARRISRLVKVGGESLTYEQASGLKDSLMFALAEAIQEVAVPPEVAEKK